jgi:hypothetical protein
MPELDVEHIKNMTKDFLYSANTYKRLGIADDNSGFYVFGVSVYDSFAEYLNGLIESNDHFDMRSMYILYERAKVTVERVEHLNNLGLIDNGARILAESRGIESDLTMSKNMMLKYEIKQDAQNIKRLIQNIRAIKEKEIAVSEMIVKNIN